MVHLGIIKIRNEYRIETTAAVGSHHGLFVPSWGMRIGVVVLLDIVIDDDDDDEDVGIRFFVPIWCSLLFRTGSTGSTEFIFGVVSIPKYGVYWTLCGERERERVSLSVVAVFIRWWKCSLLDEMLWWLWSKGFCTFYCWTKWKYLLMDWSDTLLPVLYGCGSDGQTYKKEKCDVDVTWQKRHDHGQKNCDFSKNEWIKKSKSFNQLLLSTGTSLEYPLLYHWLTTVLALLEVPVLNGERKTKKNVLK
jgi:hypothetical protein